MPSYAYLLPFLGASALSYPLLGSRIDRLWGADHGKAQAKLLGLAALVIALVAWPRGLHAASWWFDKLPAEWTSTALSAWLWQGLPGVAIVLSWLIGRSMGFGKNATTVVDGASLHRAQFRAAVPALLATALAGGLTLNPIVALLVLVVFAVMALVTVKLALAYGDELQKAQAAGLPIDPSYNDHLERKRGEFHGIALAVLFGAITLFSLIQA